MHDAPTSVEGNLIARYWCGACQKYLEGSDRRVVRAGTGELVACGTCGGVGVPEASRVVRPFGIQLLQSVRYPFRPTTLAIAAVVYAVSVATSFFSYSLSSAIQLAWIFAILRSTAMGKDDVEIDVADVPSGPFGWLRPYVRYALTFAVAFAPAIIVSAIFGGTFSPLVGALALLGSLYLPAGIVIAAHNDDWLSPLWPLPALRFIARIPGPYAMTCGFLMGTMVVGGGLALALADASVLIRALAGFWNFLMAMITGRALGILVREHGEELG